MPELKLTMSQKDDIKSRYDAGEKPGSVGADYGITRQWVRHIAKTHVPMGNLDLNWQGNLRGVRQMLFDYQQQYIDRIKAALDAGGDFRQIMQDFGVSSWFLEYLRVHSREDQVAHKSGN